MFLGQWVGSGRPVVAVGVYVSPVVGGVFGAFAVGLSGSRWACAVWGGCMIELSSGALWCGVLLVWVGGFSGCPRALFSGPGALGGSWSLGCAALSCRRGARASALWHNIPNQFLLFSGGVFLLGLALGTPPG